MRCNTFSISGNGKVCEDYILYETLSNEYSIAIMADGMGGLSHGNVAATIVSKTIFDFISTNFSINEPYELLRKAFDIANESILQKEYELKCKMGAAVCVALVGEGLFYYAWQGNVRLYKKENENIKLLTTDHVIDFDEISLLTRCINGKGYKEPIPIKVELLKKGDTIYLCSDGYYKNTTTIGSHYLEIIGDDASMIEIKI